MRFPVMPSGVEHIRPGGVIIEGEHVRFPVMPSGVEHTVTAMRSLVVVVGEISRDAVRR